MDKHIVKFDQTQILGEADCYSNTIIILCHTSKKQLGRIYMMYVFYFKKDFFDHSYFRCQFS